MAAFQNEDHYYAINVKIKSGHLTDISLEQPVGKRDEHSNTQTQPNILTIQKLSDNLTSIQLKIEGTGPVTKCFYKIGNGSRTQLGQELQSLSLSTDTAGGFQGVTLGMFTHL